MTRALSLRILDAGADRALVAKALAEVEDYYRLWLGRPANESDLDDFFTDAPPDCDPQSSDRLGVFVDGQISGLIEIAYGYPERDAAYLGQMLLAPRIRGQGIGAQALDRVESRAREKHARRIYLGVLAANPRGAAFWARHGFVPTGVVKNWEENGLTHQVSRLVKPL